MKKTTTLKLLFIAAIIGVIGSASFGQVATPPVVDGDGSDAAWAAIPAMELLRDNLGTTTSDADDFSGSVKALWDADNVYVLVEVLDDTLDTESNNPWERDHYSVYFDFGNHKSTSYLVDAAEPMDSVQFMLEKIWSTAGDLAMEDTSLIAGLDFFETIDSGTGYTLEMAIPLALIGVDLAAGDTIGFDAKIGDNDGDGSLDGKLSLYQKMDEGWQNPSYLGSATLEADGSFSKVVLTPKIDGMADYAWYGATEFALEVDNIGEGNGVENAADFSGTIQTMWDSENFYVLLEVLDDTLDTESNNPWERDHYSVYFDFGNHKSLSYLVDAEPPMDSVQFMLEKIWSVAGDLAMEDTSLIAGMDFVETIDSGTGYTLEMAIPLELIGVDLAVDQIIGWDAKIGDNDGDGSLDGKFSWHQRLDEGWQNPSFLGNLKLEAGDLEVDLGKTAKANAQIKIDGEVDGDWSQAVPMPLERVNVGDGITDKNDFSGTVRALWDTDHFFVLLEVLDDTLDTESNNPWERDHYSIYFDFGNHKSETYLVDAEPPMDSVQFMLEKIWSVEGDLAMEDTSLIWGMDFVEVIDSGTGYTVEMAIPLALIGVDLSVDQVIGWDAKIGDNDGDGSLDGKLSWNQLLDESWQNPSYMGEVTLMANGTIMGTPVVAPEDVTFNVDMNGMIDAEIFDPAVDFVDLAGSLNNWGDPVQQATDADEDGIYTIVATDQEVGAALEFKFRVNGTWDPISEFPGGGPNRTYTVVEGENVVNVVFNDGDYTPWLDDAVELNKASNIHIYPNPAVSSLNIQNVEDIHTIELVNLLGQVTYKQINSGSSTVVMPLEGQASGVYMIRFTGAANEISYKKLVIK